MDDGGKSGAKRGRKVKTPRVVDGKAGASRAGARRKPVVKASDETVVEGVPDVVVSLRPRSDGWTPIRQRAFLRYLSELGSVTDACKRVGLSRTSAQRLRNRSVEFAEAWDKAVAMVAPILEQAAFERGVEGWDEPIFQGGKQVGVKRRYSDASLRMLMQARTRAEAAGMTMPDLATASIETLNAFAEKAAGHAGGTFLEKGHGMSQAEVDAALMKRLDDLATHRRSKVERSGKVWLEGGGYPPEMTVEEAKKFWSEE